MRLNVFQIAFLFVHAIFINILDIKMIKYVCIILLIIYLFSNGRCILNKKYKKINIWVMSFAVAVTFSSIHSLFIDFPSGFDNVSVFSGVLLSLSVFTAFFILELLYEKNKVDLFIKYSFWIILIYLLINDIMLPLHSIEERADGYFIGNKFLVSYLHIIVCSMFYYLYICNRRKSSRTIFVFFIMLAFSMLVAISVQCSTAIVGTLIIVALFFFRKFAIKLYSPVFIVIYILLSSFGFIMYYEEILSLPFVNHIIVDVLHENATLTGRVNIYIAILDLLKFEPFWGWGNGNSTFFVNYFLNMPNTQNGLIEDFINWGIIGVVPFLLLVFFTVKYSERNRSNPFMDVVVMFIVLSTIEITLGAIFISILPFCLFAGNNKNFQLINPLRRQTKLCTGKVNDGITSSCD